MCIYIYICIYIYRGAVKLSTFSQGKWMEIFKDFHSGKMHMHCGMFCGCDWQGIQTSHGTAWWSPMSWGKGAHHLCWNWAVPESLVTQASTAHTCETVANSPPQMEGERWDMTLKWSTINIFCQSPKKSTLNIHRKDWCWSWSSNTLATWCEEPAHQKRPWCWERSRAEGEGDDRGWDGWMASPPQWTWVWANSERQWRTRKPGML